MSKVYVIYDPGSFLFDSSNFEEKLVKLPFYSSREKAQDEMTERIKSFQSIMKEEPDRYWVEKINEDSFHYRSGFEMMNHPEYGSIVVSIVEITVND